MYSFKNKIDKDVRLFTESCETYLWFDRVEKKVSICDTNIFGMKFTCLFF